MELVIKPKSTFRLNFKELWAYRELFWTLALRDIKVRYKQTAIGVLWALLQPFILMIVFTVFFGRIAGLAEAGVPYPLFVFTGLLFWNYFSNGLNAAAGSTVANQAMVQKIYFPRIILPLSSVVVYVVDFAIAALIFIGLMVYYGFTPSLLGIALIIPALIIASLAFCGLGLFLAAVNVKYRDVRYVLPFFLQLLLFVTPVIYPASILGQYQWLWFINPMSGVIEAMRASLLNVGAVHWQLLGLSALISVGFFAIGLLYFNKTERYFADIV